MRIFSLWIEILMQIHFSSRNVILFFVFAGNAIQEIFLLIFGQLFWNLEFTKLVLLVQAVCFIVENIFNGSLNLLKQASIFIPSIWWWTQFSWICLIWFFQNKFLAIDNRIIQNGSEKWEIQHLYRIRIFDVLFIWRKKENNLFNM